MIFKEVPKTLYCHIGGSGTWGCDFPESLDIPGITLISKDMEFETPYGTSIGMKLYKMDSSITKDSKERTVLYVPFHGWIGMSPYDKCYSERVFYVLKEAGVKYILADGSGGGINSLLEPGDIICASDFVDYTKRVSHIGDFTPYSVRMRDIVNPDLRRILYQNASKYFKRVFSHGVYAVMEPPRFETAQEVRKLRADGCDLSGHTMMPEAALSRAIGANYAALYVVSNHAEGIEPEWERSIFDIYGECAPIVGRIMIEAMAEITPESVRDNSEENIIKMPEDVQKRIRI